MATEASRQECCRHTNSIAIFLTIRKKVTVSVTTIRCPVFVLVLMLHHGGSVARRLDYDVLRQKQKLKEFKTHFISGRMIL